MTEFPDRDGYALITGGGARLGAAMTRELAKQGWAVAIHYNASQGPAMALAREIDTNGGRAMIVGGDLSRIDDFSALFATANAKWDHCSILVNSASTFEYDDISTISRASLEKLFAVNLHAPMLLARDFANQLGERASGLIVNILDQKVFNLNPDFLSYTLTKSALEVATRLLAQAMAPRVRVCGIAPGLTLRSGDQTEESFQQAHAKTPLGYGSNPQDIADALSFLVKAPAITGTTIAVDGGQHLQARSRDVMFSYGVSSDAPASEKR